MPDAFAAERGASGQTAWIDAGMSVAVADCGGESARLAERRAAQLLARHPHFRGRAASIQCRCMGDSLYLDGKLPSYYGKQLAQEALRQLPVAKRIVNRIQVAGHGG
jgi:hypothetical protein